MHQNFFHKPCKAKSSKMRLNSSANSSLFGTKNWKNAPRTFFYKACMEKTSKMHLNSTANSFPFGRKNRENASTFFIKLARQRTLKMRLNFTANSFIFGHSNCEIVPRNFSVKLACRELPKCVWTSQEIPSFLDANILKMRSELFCVKLQGENFQNASGLHGKQLVFARKNRENVPKTCLWTFEAGNTKNASELHGEQLCCETQKLGNCGQIFFTNFASREFPKSELSMLWPENGFNRENMSRTSLKKYWNSVLWNFLQWRKLRPKSASTDFQNFCWLVSKKSAESAIFFGLEYTGCQIQVSEILWALAPHGSRLNFSTATITVITLPSSSKFNHWNFLHIGKACVRLWTSIINLFFKHIL